MTSWTYQVNPENFQMEMMLLESKNHGSMIALEPRDGEKSVHVGDFVYLCETDRLKSAGLIGVAKILSLPADIQMPDWQQKFWIGKESDSEEGSRVWMKVLHTCSKLARPQFRSNPILSNAYFSIGYKGTMRKLDQEQSQEINRLIGFTPPKEITDSPSS